MQKKTCVGVVAAMAVVALMLPSLLAEQKKLGDNRDNFGPSIVERFAASPKVAPWVGTVRVIEVTGKAPMRLALVNHETGGLARVQVSEDVGVGDDIYVTGYTLETRLIPGTMSPPSAAIWYVGTKR